MLRCALHRMIALIEPHMPATEQNLPIAVQVASPSLPM